MDVHGADVDEDAEVGQAADLALDDVALVHLFVELGPPLRGLLLDEGLPREDDAVLPAILFKQFSVKNLLDEVRQVSPSAVGGEVGDGHEALQAAAVHHQTALDLTDPPD